MDPDQRRRNSGLLLSAVLNYNLPLWSEWGYFVLILMANSVTLLIIGITIKRPILTYKLIVGLALCATLFALHQVVSDRENPFALLFTAVLVVVMACRIALNAWRIQQGNKR